MFDVAKHGGSVDRPAGGFPLSLILLGLILAGVVLCCALWSPVARAGALYQCIGASGEAVFSSSKAGYHDCKVISTYAEPVPRRLPSRPPPPKPSLTGVTGSVETNAWKLAVDGSITIALDRVVGSVESSGRRLGDAQMRRESMAAVKSSAETSAALPLASAAAGTPGQWNYHESHQSPEVKAAAAASGSRVLRGAVYRIVRKDGSVEYTNLRAAARGAQVTSVYPGGPAALAGIQPHDILLRVGKDDIPDPSDLRRREAALKPGSKVELSGLRNGSAFHAEITLAQRPMMSASSSTSDN